MGFFDKLKKGLAKTKNALLSPINSLFSSYEKVDDDFFDELCDLLIMADVGVSTSEELIASLKKTLSERKIKEAAEARSVFIELLSDMIKDEKALDIDKKGINIILVIGVNGVGKTTSIGKIASQMKNEGRSVMLAAADTFRAAAIEQLEVWAKRADVPLIKQNEGADPAAVVYDAINAAKNKKVDVLIIDTAGRLHNKKNLIDELAKINRIIDRELPDAGRETFLVLDSTTGQNALVQAKEFGKAADITGLILTKLDGTAKGGIIFSINKELGVPVRYVGVGESIDDLQPFVADQFVRALFDLESE